MRLAGIREEEEGLELNRRLGFLSFLAAAFLYGTFGLFIRALQSDFGALQQVVLRSAGAVLITLPVAWLSCSGSTRQLKNPQLLWFSLLFPLSITLWTTATIIGTVRAAIFGMYFGSLVGSTIFGVFFFKEKINSKRRTGMVLNVIGLLIFCWPFGSLGSSSHSIILGSLAGIFQALALCFRRWLTDVDRRLVLAAQSLSPLLLCGVYCALFEPFSSSVLTVSNLALGFGYGATVVVVSYLVLLGSQNLEISKGSILLSTELIWATLFAACFLGEVPSTAELLGGALLVVASIAIKT